MQVEKFTSHEEGPLPSSLRLQFKYLAKPPVEGLSKSSIFKLTFLFATRPPLRPPLPPRLPVARLREIVQGTE